MGAKASTVASGQSSTGANETMQGFSILRSLPGGVGLLQHQQGSSQTSNSRQRARSLSSVPDLSSGESGESGGQALGLPDVDDIDERVYAAHSLPSHIWSLNGKQNKVPS